MVSQFIFLFLARAIFLETSAEIDFKNCHRNDVRMFKTQVEPRAAFYGR